MQAPCPDQAFLTWTRNQLQPLVEPQPSQT